MAREVGWLGLLLQRKCTNRAPQGPDGWGQSRHVEREHQAVDEHLGREVVMLGSAQKGRGVAVRWESSDHLPSLYGTSTPDRRTVHPTDGLAS